MIRSKGILRSRDLDDAGIPRVYLSRLCQSGVIERLSRGLYTLPGHDLGHLEDLATVCRRVPKGVIALISALEFHQMTTQIAHEVWLAIGHKARAPRIDYPAIQIVRFSGKAFEFGVQTIIQEGIELRVYSPAKTVADCFRFRNRIGLDVAIEALRACRADRKASMDELWEAAKVGHMSNVMKPYLESVV